MIITKDTQFHCLFEQSGTFKDVFTNLGYKSFDYDILNDFNKTDFVIDIFKEIDQYKKCKDNIFYKFRALDVVIAFFPCTYFEIQSLLHYTCNANQLKDKSLQNKLYISRSRHIKLFKHLNYLYDLIDICINNNLQLIIENPYSKCSYLLRYTPLKPDIIDLDRSLLGDKMKKPTMYFFINCEPNLTIDLIDNKYYGDLSKVCDLSYGAERSLITPEYALNFVRSCIIYE